MLYQESSDAEQTESIPPQQPSTEASSSVVPSHSTASQGTPAGTDTGTGEGDIRPVLNVEAEQEKEEAGMGTDGEMERTEEGQEQLGHGEVDTDRLQVPQLGDLQVGILDILPDGCQSVKGKG